MDLRKWSAFIWRRKSSLESTADEWIKTIRAAYTTVSFSREERLHHLSGNWTPSCSRLRESTHFFPCGESRFFKGAILEDNRDQWDRERGQKGEQVEYDQSTLHTIKSKGAGRVVHACDPVTQEAEAGGSLQVQASLGYTPNTRAPRPLHQDCPKL